MSVLKSGGSLAKVILFELCKKWLYKKNSDEIVNFQVESVEFEGSLARNVRFGASNFQGVRSFSRFAWQAQGFGSSLLEKLKKLRTTCSFRKLRCFKSGGSLARNTSFESLLIEKLRKPRTRCSFWKFRCVCKVEEDSHEMVLEATK